MKLIKAHATNYRNIIDSNPVEIGRSTCLVGKNEAGKTAFLKALECLRSTNPEFKSYGKTENYPRRYLSDDNRHEDGDAIVMRTEGTEAAILGNGNDLVPASQQRFSIQRLMSKT
jgi:predicted ATP-dependent endonuclease of OLD family